MTVDQSQDGVDPKVTVSHRRRNIVIGVLLMLLLAEVGTRAIASNLPPPLQWQGYEAQRKVQQMDALSKDGGSPIVFVGSSLVDLGIDPTVIDKEIGGVRSYNAGLLGSIPRITEPWVEQVVIPKLHPKLIVIGVSSYDFGGEDPNRITYLDDFTSSAAEKKATGHTGTLAKVSNWVGDVSSFWYHHFELRDPETVLRAIAGEKQYGADWQDVQPDGRQTKLEHDAFQAKIGIDVTDWFPGPADTDAVQRLVSYAKQRGIAVVLVDMPVTSQYVALHPNGQADYNTYLQALNGIGKATATPVLEYNASMRDNALFLDYIHLGYAGAEDFSAKLGIALRKFYP